MTGEQSEARLISPSFLLVTLGNFAYFVAVAALLPVLALFVDGPLRGSDFDVGLSVGAFAVTAVLIRPFAGRFGDRRGRKPLIIAGAAIVGASTAAYVFVESLSMLYVLRLAQGAGEALYFTGAASAITDMAPDDRRGEAVSYFSVSLYAGLAIGPLIGEALFKASGFDAVWLVSAGLSGLAVLIPWRLQETRPEGIATSTRLVHPQGLLPGAVMTASIWGFAGFGAFIPLYALELGLSGSRFVFALSAVVILAIRFFGARIPDLLGARRAATTALSVSLAGLILLGALAFPAGLFAATAVFAVGQALAFPALLSLAVGRVPPSERASLISTFTASIDVAFGLGPMSLGVVAELTNYNGVFFASAVVTAIGLAGLLARGRRLEEPATAKG